MSIARKLFSMQDMTDGPIIKGFATFAVPLLIGNIIQQLYNTVDSIVVGRYIGDHALAAVGASTQLQFLLLVLFIAISTGAGIMVAQYYGARQRELLSRTIGTTLMLMLLSSLFIMAVTPFIVRPFLELLQTPDNVINESSTYLTIIFMGVIGISFYNGISGILRGMGDSFMPLVFLSITCVLNIVLDIWFVAGLGWGIAGAAWATVISQMLSSVLCMFRLMSHRDDYELRLSLVKLDRELDFTMAKLGLPSAATQMVFSLANTLVQTLINKQGSDVMACFTIVMRVDAFAVMPAFSFGMAMSTFVGQNIGAGKMDRVNKGIRAGLFMCVAVSVALIGSRLLFGKPLMGVFTNTHSVIDLSYALLVLLSPGYLAFAFTQIFFGVMRGAGDTVSSMWISVFTTVIVRTPLAYFMVYLSTSAEYPNGRPEAIMGSLLVAWVCNAVIAGIVLRRGKWRKKSIVGVSPI